MWKRFSSLLPIVLVLLVALPGATLQADAQDGSAAAATDPQEPADGSPLADAADADSPLAGGVHAAFQVLPVSGGVVLVPRRDARGVRSLEISLEDADALSLNGEPVELADVRDRLGAARSALVEELLDLPSAERARLVAPLATTDGVATGAGDDEADEAAERSAAEATDEDDRPGVVSRRGPRTGFGTRIHVARDEVVEDVLLWDGSAEIEGTVDGDVLVFDGSLRVEGTVREDATVIGGDIFLGADSVVGGDVKSVGGEIVREDGSQVGGRVEESESNLGAILPELRDRAREEREADEAQERPTRRRYGSSFGRRMADFGGFLSFLVILALLACLSTAAAPRFIDRVGERVAVDAVRSGLVGLLVLVLLTPMLVIVSAILAVTIVGIPILVVLWVAVAFVGMPAMALAFLLGFAAVCQRLGFWLGRRFDRPLTSRYTAVVVGMVGVMGVLTLGLLVDALGSALDFFAGMFLAFGGIAVAAAALVGFGAVVMDLVARWRGRPAGMPPAAPPTPGPEDWTPSPGPPTYSPEVAPPPTPAPPPPEPPRGGPSYGEIPPEPPVPPPPASPPGPPSDDEDPDRRS